MLVRMSWAERVVHMGERLNSFRVLVEKTERKETTRKI
jgi:hypothetical protein